MPMAIIGMSGRYPKADNLDILWRNLKSGLDGVSEAQGDRWDLGFHSKDSDQPNRVYTRAGGFLDRIDLFDAEFFGMSPREAKQVDPQHRLLLELSWEAMESAGIVPSDLAGTRTGVFVGISNNDYATLVGQEIVDAYTNIGSALSISANRISYVFDLHGPSMAIDTACSSSMVAMHQACVSIASGECSMALVGGVNMLVSMKPWIGFAQASMLSPDGRCKSFDADGNGYVRAEGGGVVVVKPLADAERDGDDILGVILGTGVNSDGRTMGMAMPSGEAQEALLRQVYARCGVRAEQVFYVEAHGTGTSVGDPIECGAIGRVLGAPRKDGSTCLIGSVKSNIGHLESGAGIAGLTKVLLALRHGEMPANLHYKTPNPKIDFDGWRLAVVDKAVTLPKGGEPLIFGVNSFGFGGTNAHLVLREYRPAGAADVTPALAENTGEDWSDMLLLSAHTPEALDRMASDYAAFLREAPAADWPRIRATAALARARHPHRLAVSASSGIEAAGRLELYAAGGKPARLAKGRAGVARSRLALVYSGNGPQWWGMGRDMLAGSAIFRAEVEAVDAIFAPLSGWSLIDEMARPESETRITLTEVAQPLLFALQAGLTAVLRAAGVTPDVVLGHSVGEVAAALASGALTREQAVEVIVHRSQMQALTAGRGRMAALSISSDEAAREIETIPGWLEIAAINAPNAVTVAGEREALETLIDRLTEQGHFARLLPLDYPFHTSAMDAIKGPLLLRLRNLAPGAGAIPFISTVEGATLDGAALDAAYWWRNVRAPVQFADAVSHALTEHRIDVVLEVGPHPVLQDYLQQTIKATAGSAAVASGTLRRPTRGRSAPEIETLKTALCAVMAAGAGDPKAVFTRPRPLAKLPGPLWLRTRFWRGACELPETVYPVERDHPLLGYRLPSGDGLWTNTIQPVLLPYLNDHVVQGVPLFPATGYIEMALAAGRLRLGDGPIDIENFEIQRPLAIPHGAEPLAQTAVEGADGTVRIRARPDVATPDWTDHVKGRLSRAEGADTAAVLDLAALRATMPVIVEELAHYRGCDRRGLTYGPTFQGVRSVALTAADVAQRAALGEIALPEADITGYAAHPALLDSCLQVLITLIGQNEPRDCATIPIQVGRIRSLAPLPRQIFCHVSLRHENARSGVADMVIADADGRVLLVLEEARFQKVEFRSTALPLLAEDWRPDAAWTPRRIAAVILPSPSAIAVALACSADGHQGTEARLDAVVGRYAARALAALGACDASFTLASLARAGGVVPDQEGLLGRLIAMAEADGVVERVGRGEPAQWAWTTGVRTETPEDLWRAVMLDHPDHGAELMALARAAAVLLPRLRGEAEGSAAVAMLDSLEDTAPFRAPVNRVAAEALRTIVAAWPAHRPLHVLELNGGTGGLTAALLPVLPPERSDYLFTDASAQAVGRAAHRFAGFHLLRAAEWGEDGPAERGFDLVIGSGAIDPAKLFDCLAPGGLALVVTPPASRLAVLLFPDAGTAAPLDGAGFDVATVPAGAGHGLLIGQRPKSVVAEVPREPSDVAGLRRTLLVGVREAKSPFVTELCAALSRAGQMVTLRVLVDADLTEEGMTAVVAEEGSMDEFVHLAGWAPSATAESLAAQDMRCLSTILLARAVEARSITDQDYAPVLTLVTRGALVGPGGAGPLDPFQATLAGLGRVIANEQASLGCRLIDVHAAADDIAAAQVLADALLARDAETETLLLDGRRYLNRARVSSAAEQTRIDRSMPPAVPAEAKPFRLDFLPQGGLDSLHLREVLRRAPGPDEVEIKVHAAGLNFRDVLWTMGMLPEDAVENGFSGPSIGMECAGEIVRVGAGVATLKPGDRVIAFASSCFSSHVTTTAACAAPMPAGLSYAAAATIPTAFVTAWYALEHLARLEPGESVLIHGAAGGVGLAALQIAKLRGAVVFASAGSADKQRLVRTMGADHVLSSRSLTFADDIMRLTGHKGVDVVLNSLAGEAITKGLQILKPFGRFLEIGKRDLYANSRIGLRPFRQNLSYFGIDADTLLVERPALAKRMFDAVTAAMARGDLRPLPYQAIPVSRAAEAFRAMQQSRHVGKLVVTMDAEPAANLAVVPRLGGLVRPDVTYLVTGGLGGFGLATAHWLAGQGARSLALLSRRGDTTDEAREGLALLRSTGCAARAFAVDVADADQLDRALQEIRASMPPLKGVIHSAAVIEDAPLMKVGRDLMHRVMSAKMIGAWNLHRLTGEDGLEMFVLYSSSAAVVGNPGQGCYVAANMFLDSLAQYRRAQGRPALAVGWGAIKDAGFLTRNAGVEDMLAQRAGMEATPVREALDELGRLLAAGATRVAAAQFNLIRLGQSLAGARTPRFAGLLPEGMTMAVEGAGSLAAALDAMGEDDRRALILTRVTELVGRVVGSGAAQIDAERPLSDLGLDSLMAVELAEALEQDLGRPISVMQMIQAGTVGGIVETVMRGFRTTKSPEPTPSVARIAA